MKWRNSKERELLASGGSRDQTLPNKNNPNPDLSDAKCDRPITPISPMPMSPQNNLSDGEENSPLNETKEENSLSPPKSMLSPNTSNTNLQSPLPIHHIPPPVPSLGPPIGNSPNLQVSSPPPLLTAVKPLSHSQDLSSSSAASSPQSQTHSAITMPMTSAEFQAKINAEMHKHLVAADLKFKLESTLSEVKQRRLTMLNITGGAGGAMGSEVSHHSLLMHPGHPANNIFIANAMQHHLQQQQQQHHQLQAMNHQNHTHLPQNHPLFSNQSAASTPANQQQQQQQEEFMKMYYDDYDDSHSDSDEEISVT